MGAPKICKPPKVNFIGSAHNSSAGHLRQMPTLRLRCAYSFASALPSVSSQAQLKSFSRARGCVLYEDHARPPHPGCCATADRRSRWASYDAMSCMLFGPPAHCACAAHCGAAVSITRPVYGTASCVKTVFAEQVLVSPLSSTEIALVVICCHLLKITTH